MILINFMLIYLNLCSTKGVFRVELYDLGTWFSHFQKVYYESEFQLVFGLFSVSSWSEKGHEPSWKSFSSSYGSSQLDSDSSLVPTLSEAKSLRSYFIYFFLHRKGYKMEKEHGAKWRKTAHKTTPHLVFFTRSNMSLCQISTSCHS